MTTTYAHTYAHTYAQNVGTVSAESKALKTIFDRIEQAVSLRPEVGQKTAITKARIESGLTCQIEDGPWTFTADLDKTFGGTDQGPKPAVFARAALSSCVAMGYVVWAAKLEVPISAVEVEVEADFDVRGKFGIDGIPAGYTDITYRVTIESDAPEADIIRVLDTADGYSPNLDVFRRPQPLRRAVHIVSSEA